MTVQMIYRTICNECGFTEDETPEILYNRNNPFTFRIYSSPYPWESICINGYPKDICKNHKLNVKIEAKEIKADEHNQMVEVKKGNQETPRDQSA